MTITTLGAAIGLAWTRCERELSRRGARRATWAAVAAVVIVGLPPVLGG